jgi:hypothetical protein
MAAIRAKSRSNWSSFNAQSFDVITVNISALTGEIFLSGWFDGLAPSREPRSLRGWQPWFSHMSWAQWWLTGQTTLDCESRFQTGSARKIAATDVPKD